MFDDADGYDFDAWSEGSYKENVFVLEWLETQGAVDVKESQSEGVPSRQ